MAEITYFLDATLFFSIPHFLWALSFQLWASNDSLTLGAKWLRRG